MTEKRNERPRTAQEDFPPGEERGEERGLPAEDVLQPPTLPQVRLEGGCQRSRRPWVVGGLYQSQIQPQVGCLTGALREDRISNHSTRGACQPAGALFLSINPWRTQTGRESPPRHFEDGALGVSDFFGFDEDPEKFGFEGDNNDFVGINVDLVFEMVFFLAD